MTKPFENTLEENISSIKNRIDEANKLKEDAKNILIEHEKKISNSKAEVKSMISKAAEDKINHLIELRLEAKNNGDYQTADNIRDELSKMNVTIKDIGGKTEWEIL